MITKIHSIIFLVFVISNCFGQQKLKDYYYPFSSSKEVKIYKYINKNNVSHIEYWKVTSNPESKKMLTESFDSNFSIYNIFEEKITEQGGELLKYTDYEKKLDGELIPIPSAVVYKDVYKWNGEKKYKYSVSYKNQYGKQEFEKHRTILGFELLHLNGKEYEVVKFLDEYFINLIDYGEKYSFYQFTYYAKNIGMVKYKRYLPTNEVIELELVDILTEPEFNKEKTSH